MLAVLLCLIIIIVIIIISFFIIGGRYQCVDYFNNVRFGSKQLFRNKGSRSKLNLDINPITKKYYLYQQDFVDGLVQIPTEKIKKDENTNIISLYAGAKCKLYNYENNKVCGICSATFFCIKYEHGTYADISNYLSVDDGLIISWFTPSKPRSLAHDDIMHSMVTECIVSADTLVNKNPYYGMTFNMVVSAHRGVITFALTQIF